MKIKISEVIIIFILPLLISFGFLFIKLPNYNYLFPFLILFGLPSLYLIYRKPNALGKSFLFGLMGFGINFLFDYMALKGGVWINKTSLFTIFGVSVEAMLCAFLVSFNIALFYENFFVADKIFSFKKFLFLITPVSLLIIFSFLFQQGLFKWTYHILGIGFSMVVIIYSLINHPKSIAKLLTIAFLYFPLILLADIINLKFEQLVFTGNFFYNLSLFGVSIPFEEVFYLCFTGNIAIGLSYLYLFRHQKS